MIVVPSLPENQESYHKVVAGIITRSIWLRAPKVTNRIDSPSCMVQENNANYSAPEQAVYRASLERCSPHHCSDRRWNSDTKNSENRKQSIEPPQLWVANQILSILTLPGARFRLEIPAHLSVNESSDDSARSAGSAIHRRMRISSTVRIAMMPAVRPGPVKDRTLDSHGSQHQYEPAHLLRQCIGPMGQQPMKPSYYTKPGKYVSGSQH
jgi:hypothetical protein